MPNEIIGRNLFFAARFQRTAAARESALSLVFPSPKRTAVQSPSLLIKLGQSKGLSHKEEGVEFFCCGFISFRCSLVRVAAWNELEVFV
ncbi:hypothetical protein TNCV_3752941 [Trichonephila clavipes]|nr:hypothetical protein TNCV_3752941 [Trichonephila clavipes]